MFEQDLWTYLDANISADKFSWGKIDSDFVYDATNNTLNYFVVNNIGAQMTPSYLYQMQFSARAKYIDVAQQLANDVVKLFHLYSGAIGSYNVWVSDVITNSALYEEEGLVQIPVLLSFKFTEL